MLVLANEMPAESIQINSIALYCNSSIYNHGNFNNANILALHTPAICLTSTFDSNYNGNTPKLVMHEDTLKLQWNNGQWNDLVFDSVFKYNGTDNLLLEFVWSGHDSALSVYNKGWYPDSANGYRTLDGYPGISTGQLRPYMNSIRFYYSTYGISENENKFTNNYLKISPNPFRGITKIKIKKLAAENKEKIDLQIYDMTGKVIKSFPLSSKPQSLTTEVTWDGTDEHGKSLPSGVYLCKLKTATLTKTMSILLLR